MSTGIDYFETAPPQVLARHVACVWRLHGHPSPGRVDTIYPDGHVELIVHLGHPPMVLDANGQWVQQTNCLFAAQAVAPIQLRPTGELDCVGVRLMPAASYLLGGDPEHLLNKVVPLADIDARLAGVLPEVIAANRDHPVGAPLWAAVSQQLLGHPLEQGVERALAAIMETDGAIRVQSLATIASMSVRSLQQRFFAAVGLSPKQYCRIVRLQLTLRMLDDTERPLAQLAQEAGYFDQAHVNRETRSLIGLTPSALRAALESDRFESQTLRMAASFIRGGSGETQ